MEFNQDMLNKKNSNEKEKEKDLLINNYLKEKQQQEEQKISNHFAVGQKLAEFVAYLYKPKPRKGGFVAQFFGENGPHADTIVGLHLTRFQDIYVKVSVWVLKDKNGAVQIRNSSQPAVTEFIAKLERPSPSKDGQTALFFGKDGEDADAINVLNRSEFLDSFVFVKVQFAAEMSTIDDIETEVPKGIMEKTHLMTKEEKVEFEKKQKFYKDCSFILRNSGFFRNKEVMKNLIEVNDMLKYIVSKPCCCKGIGKECETGDKSIIPYPYGGTSEYSYIPLCKTHHNMIENNMEIGIQGLTNDFNSWSDHYRNQISESKLKQVLKLNPDEEIPPARLKIWAIKNNLYNLLPNKYLQSADIEELDR